MTRWNIDFLNPSPFSFRQSWRKFSAVWGTISESNSITILPADSLLISMSKKTLCLALDCVKFLNGAISDAGIERHIFINIWVTSTYFK